MMKVSTRMALAAGIIFIPFIGLLFVYGTRRNSQDDVSPAAMSRRFEERGILAADDYIRLRSIQEEASHTGKITDSDCAWSLSLLNKSQPNPIAPGIVSARVFATSSLLRSPSDFQRNAYLAAGIKAVGSSDALERASGIRVIRYFGSSEHLPLVLPRLDDNDKTVRIEAKRAVDAFGYHSVGDKE